MADRDSERFQVRTGRMRNGRAPVNSRTLPFVRQVEIAIRKQGGNPNRLGASSGAGKGSGRFNARGRGGKLAAGLPKDGGGWKQDGNGIRFRSRRVVVKARVVKLPKQEPRAADRNISSVAGEDGIYRPSQHLEAIRETFLRQGKDPDAFVRFHVRRLEALRRAGHVERIDEDHWRIPKDLSERGIAYDGRNAEKDFSLRVLSTFDLDAQVGSDGATWLDRELTAKNPMPLVRSGFGLDVDNALDRRAAQLVRMGNAERDAGSGTITFARDLVATLERQEVTRVGKQMAAARGLIFTPVQPGDHVGGTLLGSVGLASGRFAMLDDGLGFQLVPWQPMLDKRIGQHIGGVVQGSGGIDWSFGRKRGVGIGM
ncbi:DUF3363 domain-containing protein [Mesorhizobium sp. ISC25]|uniref:DUF3363 domain-containing protein n=1 Tax=Mesorhizobium sp. ISC25 TaxID=3077335 RepID=UPI0035E391FB